MKSADYSTGKERRAQLICVRKIVGDVAMEIVE